MCWWCWSPILSTKFYVLFYEQYGAHTHIHTRVRVHRRLVELQVYRYRIVRQQTTANFKQRWHSNIQSRRPNGLFFFCFLLILFSYVCRWLKAVTPDLNTINTFVIIKKKSKHTQIYFDSAKKKKKSDISDCCLQFIKC